MIGIDEDFEKNVLHIENVDKKCEEDKEIFLEQVMIKFALDNGYAQSEADIDINIIKNVFIPGNEVTIEKFSGGKIPLSEFERKIGFEVEFGEAYFSLSKFEVKTVEAKLLEIKKSGSKEKVRKSKLLVSLYCYIVKNGLTCGLKNKMAKRNKALKPEILEELIK